MSSKPKLSSLTGMHDILPEDQIYYEKVQKSVQIMAGYYHFQRIDTPVLEYAEVFSKGLGVATDMIEKEMYVFRSKSGDLIALRPEFTAGIVRSYIEQGMTSLPQPVKLWTMGSCFRHERPQAGRYRELRQFDFEVLGEKDPLVDAQMIQMSFNILRDLSIGNLAIDVNSIGDQNCQPYFKKILTNYFKARKSSLCADCQRRLKENPLRILDCKDEKCQRIKMGAPQIIDHLCQECHAHFKQVLEFLDELELPYVLNPYLVRGIDYYTKTVFEISEKSDDGKSQGSLVGGGRYDKLVKILGGKDTPSCGAAGGVERIINLMKKKNITTGTKPEHTVFLAQLGQMAKRKSLKLFEGFRTARIPIGEAFSKDSLKAQLKIADKMGIRWVLIMGQKEALENFVTLKDMTTGVQREIKLDKVILEIKEKLKK